MNDTGQNTVIDLKRKWYTIIFRHDTRWGRLFDEIILILILLSVLTVFIDSMETSPGVHKLLLALEWFFTIAFTIEYVARILVSYDRKDYIFSFYGIIDLLAILPTYLSIFMPGTQYLIIIRALRLLRIFRILKLARFTRASYYLTAALHSSREKILVFFGTVLMTVTIVGTMMYIIEGPAAGFDNIPISIYWAIVTITTVGFGDITPVTALGQLLASLLMLTGYAIIAVPTGIITSNMTRISRDENVTKGKKDLQECQFCNKPDNLSTANYCSNCGSHL